MKRFFNDPHTSMMVESISGAWVRWEDAEQAEHQRDEYEKELRKIAGMVYIDCAEFFYTAFFKIQREAAAALKRLELKP